MLTQGSFYIQEWQYGDAVYDGFSDIHITCKYGWINLDNNTTQVVGTLTDVSLAEYSSHDFITILGDSHTIEASWDDEQNMMQQAGLWDVVFTVDNQKINKMSWNPTESGWITTSECDTVDYGINHGSAIDFLNYQRYIHIETQTDTQAWQTTPPYFGTGVIADGVYIRSPYDDYTYNYIIIDGTNHPGELSFVFSQDDSWDSDHVKKYSKQTSGCMFYMWDTGSITQCSNLNHYTWDLSQVSLCYDNTTELSINGIEYTKLNPSPSYYEILCGFTFAGSVRPAKAFIRWGTNEPYTEISILTNPHNFSWQERSVPSGEVGTLVVEFVDSNNNGLIVDSYSSQDYVFDTDTAGSYGGTRLLIKSPDNSNIYDYAAGNFIECNVTLSAAPQPTQPDLTDMCFYNENREDIDGVIYFKSPSVFAMGTCNSRWNYEYTMTYDSDTELWNIVFKRGPDSVTMYYNQDSNVLKMYGYTWVFVSSDPCEDPDPQYKYTVTVKVSGQGTTTGEGGYEEGDNVTLTATPASGWEFVAWHDSVNYEDYFVNPLTIEGINRDWNIVAFFEDKLAQPDLTDMCFYNANRETDGVIYFNSSSVFAMGTCNSKVNYEYTMTYDSDTGLWNIVFRRGPDSVTMYYDKNSNVLEMYGYTYVFVSNPCGGPDPQPTEKHIYLCDNSGAHLAEMTNTGSTWGVSGAFTSGQYSIRATVENEYNDAWFKFYQTSGDNRIFVGSGDDPSFEDIGTYIMIDDILTSFSLTEDQETGYYVVNYQNTGAMTTSMVDTIVNSYIGDFVTGSDIAEMGYMTATDISSMNYVDTTYLANQDYSTKNYMMSYVSDAISGIQPGGSSTKTVTMSCTGGDESFLTNATFYIPNSVSNVTFVQKWQRTNSTSCTWTIYNFNMGSTAAMRIGLPTGKYVSSLTLTCNGYSDTLNVMTVPQTPNYQDIYISYWNFQHVWDYLNDYDWNMNIIYSYKPQSIDIDWMINNSPLQLLASERGLTSVEHGSQNISDFTSDVVLTDMKTLDNSGRTNVYLNGVSTSMEDMIYTNALLFRTSNLNATNPTKSDIESIWETAKWYCIEEYGTPATIGDWEVVYYINVDHWCPAEGDALANPGDPTEIVNNFYVTNWVERPSDQYKYFYYIKDIQIVSMV